MVMTEITQYNNIGLYVHDRDNTIEQYWSEWSCQR